MRKKYFSLALIVFVISAASSFPQLFSLQKVTATITDNRLIEASGLEESFQNEGYFWTHNDSGRDPTLYLIDTQGEIKMEVELKGINNRDWEEIVTVKKDGRSLIYVAEIGDNKAVHDNVKLICFEEPTYKGKNKIEISNNKLKIMSFKYAEGARDAEAILFDKRSDEFVLVTKREDNALVYSFPFEVSDEPTVIQSKGTVPAKLFTAADMNDEGEILLKHYSAIYYWEKSTESALSRILKWKPISIDYSPEPQGEAICWYKGDFYTISEKNKGKPQEMLYFQRLQ
ncbi:hypothetical protein [Ekhidna sp.]|uniref:hypothetical protein n=1 Tax=Ekhidna sp. TaxID=2608089 RepID=UPI0032984039